MMTNTGIPPPEEAGRTLAKWMEYRNTECPHQVLDYDCPVNLYLSGCYSYGELTGI